MAMNISSMVDGATQAFVTLAISAIVVAVVFNLDLVNSSSLVTSVNTEIENGMTQLAGLVVLIIIILVLRFLRSR